MKVKSYYHLFLIGIIFLCLVGIALENFGSVHGLATASTTSNVTFLKSLAIDFSSELAEGIQFGYINFLPAVNINASHNYDGFLNGSTFYVNVSYDGNVPVDFCIRSNGGLMNLDGDEIGLGNETYSYFNMSNLTNPSILLNVPLTTTYVSSGLNIPVGSANYWRFWLDVPAGQPTGSYNNTVSIKGMESGESCN